MVVLRGNAWVVRTVDVFLLPLAFLLLVELIVTRLLLLRRLLIVLLLIVLIVVELRLLLRLRLRLERWLITRVVLRLAACVGSGG